MVLAAGFGTERGPRRGTGVEVEGCDASGVTGASLGDERTTRLGDFASVSAFAVTEDGEEGGCDGVTPFPFRGFVAVVTATVFLYAVAASRVGKDLR